MFRMLKLFLLTASLVIFSLDAQAKTDLDRYHECLDLQNEHLKYCVESECIRKHHRRFRCILKKAPKKHD